MNVVIAKILLGFLMCNPNLSYDQIISLVGFTQLYAYQDVLTDEQIELYSEQCEKVKELS